MINYLIYNKHGEITRKYNLTSSDKIKKQSFKPGEAYIEGNANANTQYIDPVTMEIKNKPLIKVNIQKLVSVNDLQILNDLPIPCVVLIDNEKYEINDGYLELSFEYPGSYALSIVAVNKLPFHTVIHVS